MDQPSHLTDRVKLVGFDFGSTTSSALVASARIAVNCATGRMEFGSAQVVTRCETVFTPFKDNRIDLEALSAIVKGWLRDSGIERGSIFAGGAIVTGLAARQDNARELTALVQSLIGEAVVATADDPRLESWLAFMGSACGLSRASPQRPILNLDIGGGTTNAALGLDGNVLATGSCFIGARHLRFEPGSYRLLGASEFGRALLDEHGIRGLAGDELSLQDVGWIVGFYVRGLEALATCDARFFEDPGGSRLQQAPFVFACESAPAISFSGGVGELVYMAASGQPLPGRTFYGDLGVDLARGIVASDILSRDVGTIVPENKGRATVQGLTLHSTEVSGTTLFLPEPSVLPLNDLPVVASIQGNCGRERIEAALQTAGDSERGVCLQVVWPNVVPSLEDIRRFAAELSAVLTSRTPLSNAAPIVLLTEANVGKALGNYATGWQLEHRHLIVIDEIPVRNAQFVNIGRPRHGVVPVSFYGMTSAQGTMT